MSLKHRYSGGVGGCTPAKRGWGGGAGVQTARRAVGPNRAEFLLRTFKSAEERGAQGLDIDPWLLSTGR